MIYNLKLFKETTKEFLSTVQGKGINAKRNCLDTFYKYVTVEQGIKDSTIKPYLEGVGVEELINSLGFFIEEKSIEKKSGCTQYRACLLQYFKYLIDKQYIASIKLKTEEDLYNSCINEYLNNHPKMKEVKTSKPLNDEEIQIVLSKIEEEILSNVKIEEKFELMICRLIIKIVALTGIPYKCARMIKSTDINIDYGTLFINELTIDLPYGMRDDLKRYIKMKEQMQIHNVEYLLCDIKGNQVSDKTTNVDSLLKSVIDGASITSVRKYSIINMIENGITEHIILKLSTCKSNIYDDCQKRIYDKILKEDSQNRYINSKVRRMKIFDIL